MPSVPNTWLEDFVANLKTTGTQGDPVITQLASGHILVVWTDFDDTGVGSPAGSDIVGRIFDSQGNAVTGDILLNTRNQVDSESDPSVVALPNGGFTITYDESGSFTDVNIQTYGFNPATNTVSFVSSTELFFDSGDVNPFGTVIAATSSSTALAAYTAANADGSETVFVRAYNPTTNALGTATSVFIGAAGTGENISAPSIAALSNGNFAVAFVNNNNGANNDSVELYIRTNTGASFTSLTVASGADFSDVSVAAVNSGHIVVAYNNLANNGDITYRVFTNAGVANGGPFTDGGGPNSQNEQAVIGLADGTFVIVWDDDTSGQIVGQRYGISGSGVFAVTGNFVVDNTGGTGISEIELSAFADGRFAVTWSADGNIRTKIMDTRDLVNSVAVYSPNSEQVGTIGNDVFTADGGASKVFGHNGNDIITENGSIKQYFGGEGNDTLKVVSAINDDVHNGGNGSDTIDWSLSGVIGATFDLLNGLASTTSDSEIMTAFENLIATNNNDIIIGTGGENTITALNGNDIIEGGFSTDTIDAGAGDDRIIVQAGQFADNVIGGSGIDTYQFNYLTERIKIDLAGGTLQVFASDGTTAFGPALTVSGVEKVVGGALKDVINGNSADNSLDGGAGDDTLGGKDGNDTLIGGTGADYLSGGTGSDTANYISAAAAVGVSLYNPAVNTGDAAGDTFNSIENLSGSNFNDGLNGNLSVNTIRGRDGNDTIKGYSGNDLLFGDNGNDTLIGGLGADTLTGGGGTDTASYRDATAGVVASLANPTINTGEAAGDTYSAIENIVGSDFNDSVFGNSSNNTVNGGLGNDALKGYAGNDILTGGSGNDIFNFNTALNATTNVDVITDFNFPTDTIQLDNAVFTAVGAVGTLLAAAFKANTTGQATDANDRIIYETDNGRLYYDADGTGGTARIQFATLDSGLGITNADFIIV